ncbi:stage III sporulation protein AB [Niameybacter massiliensis]|uniref:stage III sporulation protein AB n=1 Tax=Niameybacter massiliensis TaxID=1658108 RepID=UPI0009E3FA9B|nr:stage III sporulation protein AB [Niameybacter massiliensis]
MLKIMGILMIFTGCSLTGICIDMRYRKRIKELEYLIYAFEYLKGEINYRLTPLHEACFRVGKDCRHEIGQIFITFSTLLQARNAEDGGALWRQALENEKHRYHLNDEDYELIYEFGRGLGHVDKQMQQGNIEMMQEKLKMTLNMAQKEQEKSGKLRTGMGILIGACISILII